MVLTASFTLLKRTVAALRERIAGGGSQVGGRGEQQYERVQSNPA